MEIDKMEIDKMESDNNPLIPRLMSSPQYLKWGEQAISASLHICIMVWFEIYLFFWYIIPIEKQLIQTQVLDYLKSLDELYDQFVDESTQLILANAVREDSNIQTELQHLRKSYLEGKHNQEDTVRELQTTAFHMFSVVMGIFIALLFVHIPMLRKMNWMVILTENAGMLIGLGCFQFLFFTHVVLKYSPLSDTDIQYWCATHMYQTISGGP